MFRRIEQHPGYCQHKPNSVMLAAAHLRDECQPRPQVVETNGRDVNPINEYLAFHRIYKAENTHRQSGFATSSAAEQTDTFTCLQGEGDVVQHRRQVRGVLHSDVLNSN